MSEWVVCGSCQLKHQRRPDAVCPRCKASVNGVTASTLDPTPSQYAPPKVDDGPAKVALAPGTVSTGAKIAGAIFIINGVFTLIEFLRGIGGGGVASGMGSSIVSPIFDFIIGGSLLANNDKWLNWAKIRVIIGMVLFSGMSIAEGDYAGMVVQVVFSVSLLLLLFGEASKPRIAIGASMAGIVLVLVILGTFMDTTGTNPLGGLTYAGQTEPVPSGVVEGQLRPYKLTLPNSEWVLRKDEFSKKDNELSDRWVLRPDADAHVMVIVEVLEDDQVVDVNAYQTAVIDNLKAASKDLKMLGETPSINGIMFKTESSIDGMKINHLVRLYVDRGVAVQVMGFAPVAAFPAQEDDLRSILHSFKL